MTAKQDAARSWRSLRTPFATIVLLYIAVVFFFRETLSFSFFQDDYFFLSQLKTVRPWDLLLGTPVIPPYFRPLATNWLPWLNDKLWGPSPSGYYLQLYLVVAMLFYYMHALLRRLLNHNVMAWFGTALYAFSYAWPYNMGWPVTGNIELIAPMAYIASINYFLAYIESGAARHQIAMLLFLFAGIASKEYVFATPAVLVFCYFLLPKKKTSPTANTAVIH